MKTRLMWRHYWAVGLCFGLLVYLLTLPAPFTLSTHLIGNDMDNWVFYWNDWWLAQALETGRPVLFTPYLFFPQGASLVSHSNSFLSSLLALPLRYAIGPVAAANLVWLFGLWIGAVGMFWLAYDLTRSPAGALVAGFVFTFAPYHITQALAHANLGYIHWWPWYTLMLRRMLQTVSPECNGTSYINPQRQWGYALVTGLFAALTLWTGLQLAVMLALWTVGYVIWTLARPPRSRSRLMEAVKQLSVVALVAVLLSAPLLIPISRNWQSGWVEDFDESVSHQTDLLAYLIPPKYHPLWGSQVQSIYERFIANRSYMPYLGYTALLLALFINGWTRLLRNRKPTSAGKSVRSVELGFWLVTLFLWVLLAAGSAPRVNGVLYETIRLPYSWISNTFPISTLRSPDRLNGLVVFSLATLTGYGASQLTRRRWTLLPLGLLLLTEYLCLPLPRWELPPGSPFYAKMAADSTDYAVLDYPMGYDQAKVWLYYQTLHGKPTVDGHISRYTPELYSLITSNSLIRALYQNKLHEKPVRLPGNAIASQTVPPEDVGAAIRELADLGVRYILVHKPYMDAAEDAHFRRILPLAPVYGDETLEAYDLTTPLAVTYDGFPVTLSADLALVRFDARLDDDDQWRIQLVAQARRDLDVLPNCTLILRDAAALPVYTADVKWQAESLTAEDLVVRELAAQVTVLPGDYQWGLICEQAQPYYLLERWVVAVDSARYARAPSSTVFADAIALAGYRWRTEGAQLKLSLYWDVLQAPYGDYKFFIHLLNANGVLVEQYDAIPCAWTCPTSGWQTGQHIQDSAMLNLWNLPAGDYRLAIGWYHAETGERLRAPGAEDGVVILPEPFSLQRR